MIRSEPIGHNSGEVNAAHLRAFVERIEKLDEEQRALGDDKKEVYAEAKGAGYDAKIIREIVKFRKMKPDDLRERNAVLQTYASALGLDLL